MTDKRIQKIRQRHRDISTSTIVGNEAKRIKQLLGDIAYLLERVDGIPGPDCPWYEPDIEENEVGS